MISRIRIELNAADAEDENFTCSNQPMTHSSNAYAIMKSTAKSSFTVWSHGPLWNILQVILA